LHAASYIFAYLNNREASLKTEFPARAASIRAPSSITHASGLSLLLQTLLGGRRRAQRDFFIPSIPFKPRAFSIMTRR
jgi:hypothetical protein